MSDPTPASSALSGMPERAGLLLLLWRGWRDGLARAPCARRRVAPLTPTPPLTSRRPRAWESQSRRRPGARERDRVGWRVRGAPRGRRRGASTARLAAFFHPPSPAPPRPRELPADAVERARGAGPACNESASFHERRLFRTLAPGPRRPRHARFVGGQACGGRGRPWHRRGGQVCVGEEGGRVAARASVARTAPPPRNGHFCRQRPL